MMPVDGSLRKTKCPDTSIACKSPSGGCSSSQLRPMTFEAMANVAGSPRGHSEKMSLGDTRQQKPELSFETRKFLPKVACILVAYGTGVYGVYGVKRV
jgi:hypothetical protein